MESEICVMYEESGRGFKTVVCAGKTCGGHHRVGHELSADRSAWTEVGLNEINESWEENTEECIDALLFVKRCLVKFVPLIF